jgi:hypothetical protein
MLGSNNAKCNNGGLATSLTRNSQPASVDPSARIAFKKNVAHACHPLGALRGSGGLLNFFGMQITRRWNRYFDKPRKVMPNTEKRFELVS